MTCKNELQYKYNMWDNTFSAETGHANPFAYHSYMKLANIVLLCYNVNDADASIAPTLAELEKCKQTGLLEACPIIVVGLKSDLPYNRTWQQVEQLYKAHANVVCCMEVHENTAYHLESVLNRLIVMMRELSQQPPSKPETTTCATM